jgi:hypothetical protein
VIRNQMSTHVHGKIHDLEQALGPNGEGFAFVDGADMAALIQVSGPFEDWTAFTESWTRLETDTYMADGGRYRRRRYATYETGAEGRIVRAAHQPHFQTRDYNPLNGGVARWFEPIEAYVGSGASMQGILGFCATLFGRFAPSATWHVEVHQFRIEARSGEEGRPTPEGLHRDGVDYVLVLLIARQNIASGMTTVHAFDGRQLGHFTLTHPFDAALLDDMRVAHGVTPVEPLDPSAPAYRDVLVVTFRRQG